MGLPTTESIYGICCSIDCEGWQAISPGGPQPVLTPLLVLSAWYGGVWGSVCVWWAVKLSHHNFFCSILNNNHFSIATDTWTNIRQCSLWNQGKQQICLYIQFSWVNNNGICSSLQQTLSKTSWLHCCQHIAEDYAWMYLWLCKESRKKLMKKSDLIIFLYVRNTSRVATRGPQTVTEG